MSTATRNVVRGVPRRWTNLPKPSALVPDIDPPPRTGGQDTEDFGRYIYSYTHLQTKQVVYSLKRAPGNNAAIRQLPYNGKKTVPAALRKDLWVPLAMIEFQPGHNAAGLHTFQRLREYRKLHETQWPLEMAKDKDGKTLTRKQRGRNLCDQKANSIADMAAALQAVTIDRVHVEGGVNEPWAVQGITNPKTLRKIKQTLKRKEWLIKSRLESAEKLAANAAGLESAAGEAQVAKKEEPRPAVRALVKWWNLFDAEFAEKWPETVVHDQWDVSWNNRPRVQPQYYKPQLEKRREPIQDAGEVNMNETGNVVL